jgi:hypothetical protein
MKHLLWLAVFAVATGAGAAEVTCEGSYTTHYKNDRPNRIKGGVNKTGANQYEGELTTDWKGSVQRYRGTLTGNLQQGEVEGDFVMAKTNRRFRFTAQADNGVLRGPIVELKGGSEAPCGELELRVTDSAAPPAAAKPAPAGMGQLPTMPPLRR